MKISIPCHKIEYSVCYGFSTVALGQIVVISLYSQFVECFHYEKVLILSNAFSALFEMIVFFFSFILLMQCIAYFVAEHGLQSTWVQQLWYRGYFSCGALAQLSCSEILVPLPVIEPTSPAMDGGFLTTGPPGKSYRLIIF